jgi:hypothetical protein
VDRLTLHLEPGLRLGRSHIEPEPDIPLDPVTLTVPLFPGAVPTTDQQRLPAVTYFANPYLKSAMANFKLPSNFVHALLWYRDAFTESGYRVQGTNMKREHGVLQSSGLQFQDVANSKVIVSLSFQDLPGGQTHAFYLAAAVTLPPRPSDSYLPTDIRQVRIEYRPWRLAMRDPSLHLVLEERTSIERLIDAINSLTDIAAGGFGGGSESHGQGARLTFVTESGTEVPVSIRPSHRLVRVAASRTLIDTGGVWDLVSQLCDGTPNRLR